MALFGLGDLSFLIGLYAATWGCHPVSIQPHQSFKFLQISINEKQQYPIAKQGDSSWSQKAEEFH